MRTIQALAGAVLQDNDDYYASLLNSITSHAAHAITLDFTPQGSHTERVQLPGRAVQRRNQRPPEAVRCIGMLCRLSSDYAYSAKLLDDEAVDKMTVGLVVV